MYTYMCTYNHTNRQITVALALALKIEDIYDTGCNNGNGFGICNTFEARKYLNKKYFISELFSSNPLCQSHNNF